MKATKFPKEFTEKVDIRKVNLASESSIMFWCRAAS